MKSIRQVSAVKNYIAKVEKEVNKLEIVPRNAGRFPFDIVCLAIVSKAFALSHACLILIQHNFPDEAFGLSRSLVECAVNLRYLTAEPDAQEKRARSFVNYAKPHKAYWYHVTLQITAGKKKEKEVLEYGTKHGLVADYKSIHRHWSGSGKFVWDVMNIDHPLDGRAKAAVKKTAYAVDYSQPTMFVHCLIPAIDNYFCEDEKTFVVSRSSKNRETRSATLLRVFSQLHFTIGYMLFGLNIDRPKKLDTLFRRTLKSFTKR